MKSATRNEEYNPFAPPEKSIEKHAIEEANRIVHKEMNYTVLCSLQGLGNEPTRGESFEMGNGISVRIPQESEQLLYASRFLWAQYQLDSKFLEDSLRKHRGILEFSVQIDISSKSKTPHQYQHPDIIKKQAYDYLDLFKCTLQAIGSSERPPGEGTHIYFDSLDWLGFHGLQRFLRQHSKNMCGTPTIDGFDMAKVVRLFDLAVDISKKSEDFSAGIYFYGRGCIADLSRDRLVEAVIGMERLLATKHESTYKLGLHGAALLANSADEADKISKRLRKLYGERSNAVHGGAKKEQELANEGLLFLCRLINRLLILIEGGEIDLAIKTKIAKKLEELILKKSLLCSQG